MRVVAFLTSRGFAIFLLFTSVVALIVRVKRPEFYSPLFLLIPASLLLSLILCTARRLKRGRRDMRFLGSILFHTGLIVWVITLFASPLVRFSARLFLVKDMDASLEDSESVEVYERPLLGERRPILSFLLKGYEERYEDGVFPVDYVALLSIGYMDGRGYRTVERAVRINQPIEIMGYRFLFESGGWTPLFRLMKGGKVIFNRYVLLSNDTAQEDSFRIEEAGLEIYTRFFPDMFREGSKVGTRSRVVRNPAFGIKIARDENPFVDIYRGVLKKGEKLKVDGMTFEFVDLKPFVVIQMVRDPLYYFVFTGWGMGILGLLLRYGPVGRRR